MGDGNSKGSLRVTHNAEWRFSASVRLSRKEKQFHGRKLEEMKSIRVDYAAGANYPPAYPTSGTPFTVIVKLLLLRKSVQEPIHSSPSTPPTPAASQQFCAKAWKLRGTLCSIV